MEDTEGDDPAEEAAELVLDTVDVEHSDTDRLLFKELGESAA